MICGHFLKQNFEQIISYMSLHEQINLPALEVCQILPDLSPQLCLLLRWPLRVHFVQLYKYRHSQYLGIHRLVQNDFYSPDAIPFVESLLAVVLREQNMSAHCTLVSIHQVLGSEKFSHLNH